MASQLVRIAYVGDNPEVEVRNKTQPYTFRVREPKAVPEAFAEQLLRSDIFILADELDRTIEDRFPGAGLISVRRWGAMGDLIQFRAACSAFRRRNPQTMMVLRCESQFRFLFEHDPLWSGIWPCSFSLEDYRGHASFNQVAEADHRGLAVHRLEIFASFMSKTPLDITPEDWKLPVPAAAKEYVRAWLDKRHLSPGKRTRPLIGLQVHGSGPVKSLPRRQMEMLARELTTTADVALIEREEHDTWEAPGVHSMTGRDALHAIELLSHCDLCVCQDSGVLWLAHCAACPVLCLLGPTRPSERLTYHPLYRAGGAQAVLLNDIIELNPNQPGCPSCFEAATACGHSFACMQKQPDRVVQLIADKAREMIDPSRRPVSPAATIGV